MVDWLPIASAPRDGTELDLWVPYYGDGYRATDCWWREGGWWESSKGRFVSYAPTHWMKTPAPPHPTEERED